MQISDGFKDVLPLFSYIVNILTKVLEVFASYLGFDIRLPNEKTTVPESTTAADTTAA